MVDPDLQMERGGGQSFGPWVRGGAPQAPPLDPPLHFVYGQRHYVMTSVQNWPEKVISLWHNPFRSGLRKQMTFHDTPTVFLWNDVWETSTEIAYWWHITTQIWVVLLIGWSKFHQSSVWNFCARFLAVISWGKHWWHCKMSSVFSAYFRRFQ